MDKFSADFYYFIPSNLDDNLMALWRKKNGSIEYSYNGYSWRPMNVTDRFFDDKMKPISHKIKLNGEDFFIVKKFSLARYLLKKSFLNSIRRIQNRTKRSLITLDYEYSHLIDARDKVKGNEKLDSIDYKIIDTYIRKHCLIVRRADRKRKFCNYVVPEGIRVLQRKAAQLMQRQKGAIRFSKQRYYSNYILLIRFLLAIWLDKIEFFAIIFSATLILIMIFI